MPSGAPRSLGERAFGALRHGMSGGERWPLLTEEIMLSKFRRLPNLTRLLVGGPAVRAHLLGGFGVSVANIHRPDIVPPASGMG